MKIVVTIHETEFDAALQAIRALDAGAHMVELRVDAFHGQGLDLHALRESTRLPIILTNRGGQTPDVMAAVEAGIDFLDVEYAPGVEVTRPDRTVLSHHDYETVPDIPALVAEMRRFGCAHTKIAATPNDLGANRTLLQADGAGLTLIGMGERGLYSRILAPFFGSALTFVARNGARSGAPGQLTLEQALAIFGDGAVPERPRVFAVAGNPAGHSLSPSIHNPLFRANGADAAYSIASVESFDEVAAFLESGELTGVSVTAPFKDDAFAFAERSGAGIAPNAREARSVNTIVRTARGLLADNTDVDGFERLLRDMPRTPACAAVVGAGGTARAALVALRRLSVPSSVYNRSPEKAWGLNARPLDQLSSFAGDLVINATPVAVGVPMTRPAGWIDARYADSGHSAGNFEHYRGGLDLLRAQAVRQNELFTEAARAIR